MTQAYIGIKHDSEREIFRASSGPTEELYGSLYAAVIGPFRTMRGAKYMLKFGRNNPHLQTIGDAERAARTERKKIIEYGECQDGMESKVMVLAEKTVGRKDYKLIRASAGYECAGAAMRWTDGYFAVRYFDTVLNATYGRRFTNERDARQYLEERR